MNFFRMSRNTVTAIVLPLSVAGSLMAPFASHAAANSAMPSIFDTTEVYKSSLKPFPKWLGVLDRHFQEKAKTQKDCRNGGKCPFDQWYAFLGSLKDKPPLAQIDSVNQFVNTHRYIVDPINWGVKDYWASPLEFFTKNGDCEDYSIVKYLSLRALGWSAESLRVVVLQDLNLGVAHAILVVRHDRRNIVLDNQLKTIVDASRIHHYRPIYSVSEFGWWRHFPKR